MDYPTATLQSLFLERNNAFRELKKNMTQNHVIEYQRKRAAARRTIKYTKKRTWREFCSTIGRGVKLGDVWSMFKRMSGKRKWGEVDGERMAVTDKEKADMLGRTLAAVHSREHLSDIHRQQKQQLLEKAYDCMWRDGLLIKLSRMGIGGRMYQPGLTRMRDSTTTP